MKIVFRLLGLALLLAGVGIGFHFATIESGEVAALSTQDADGATQTTRLWVVEHEGRLWLNAGNDQAAWLARIRAQPEVDVTFRGQAGRYRAVPVPEARPAILSLMDRKYGWADRWVRGLVGVESVPVRLDPVRDTTSGNRQRGGEGAAILGAWKPHFATTFATRRLAPSWWRRASAASA